MIDPKQSCTASRALAGLLGLLLAACAPRGSDDGARHELLYLLQGMEREARTAARGDEAAFDALKARRRSIEARVAILVERQETSSWERKSQAAARTRLQPIIERWEVVKLELDRLLSSREVLIEFASDASSIRSASFVLAASLDEIARTLVASSDNPRHVHTVMGMVLLAWRINEWPASLLEIDAGPVLDGRFWSCGRNVHALIETLIGLRDGYAEFGIEAVESQEALSQITKSLQMAAELEASIGRICARERELDLVYQALETLRFDESQWEPPDARQ